VASFAAEADRDTAISELRRALPDLTFTATGQSGGNYTLRGVLTEQAVTAVQTNALRQNITTLHNRINELGVAEPIIQQQGSDRIIVQLPGVQDVAMPKELLERPPTLEIRMVELSPSPPAALAAGTVAFGLDRLNDTDGRPVRLRRQVIITGENLRGPQPRRDQQPQQPTVNLTL